MFPFLNTMLWMVCMGSVAVAVVFGLLAIWYEGDRQWIWKVEQTSGVLFAGSLIGAVVNWLVGTLFS